MMMTKLARQAPALFAALMLCAGCDPSPTAAQTEDASSASASSTKSVDSQPQAKYVPKNPDEQLAFIDSPSDSRPSDKVLSAYTMALRKLGEQYEGSPEQIADSISRLQGALKDDCVNKSTLQIMQDMDQHKAPSIKVAIKEAAALYLMMHPSQDSSRKCRS